MTSTVYQPILSVRETEKAIKLIKDFFQTNLAEALNLERVTAPLFVESGTGINDDLNGVEQPVRFHVKDMNTMVEIVQSLAKWKRLALADLNIPYGRGIYTDMNAIRPDEVLDELHSIYVDQWDWERVISEEERTIDFLKSIVQKIYDIMRRTEWFLQANYPEIKPVLPEEITFIHSQELEDRYPTLEPQEREDAICKEHGAVFIIGIGAPLRGGKPHDSRAPDYDDWISKTGWGYGLNGDIVCWYPLLNRSFEISSMGIRVSPESLEEQLEITGTTERKQLFFHKRLLSGELPFSIGGGIGQSRLCMFFLRKAHIGEIQVGIWPAAMIEACRKNNIILL
ncbi:MAG: aspartate--ammonia ligase [Candidatus Aminicenantes bacterium]|nr:aspartate--ammonia ligase [Candidatus Aminicenantes bacterium]NIM78814.1 aspartate--ammonia ligase [Candidatus Aminicenantes bacterium]NIN18069.1 aspartate--ammonia ligase [Candidatus Aminicenantes bacterium]NIN41968.1 aspartate--ammonia ligase [Candidatus Aminicenantes bacterium]NIN84724.1 aspartate--ammonia ligase [Candidatus Aminicenantes bacterium]